ncbi:hypothetical protein Hanom_Chr15g01402161 [Helianthus anomalus]
MNILFEFCVSFRSPLLNRKKLAKQGDDLEAAAAAAVLINIRRIHGFRYFHFLLEIFHNILPCSLSHARFLFSQVTGSICRGHVWLSF